MEPTTLLTIPVLASFLVEGAKRLLRAYVLGEDYNFTAEHYTAMLPLANLLAAFLMVQAGLLDGYPEYIDFSSRAGIIQTILAVGLQSLGSMGTYNLTIGPMKNKTDQDKANQEIKDAVFEARTLIDLIAADTIPEDGTEEEAEAV